MSRIITCSKYNEEYNNEIQEQVIKLGLHSGYTDSITFPAKISMHTCSIFGNVDRQIEELSTTISNILLDEQKRCGRTIEADACECEKCKFMALRIILHFSHFVLFQFSPQR